MTSIRYIEEPGRKRTRLETPIRACIVCLGIALTALAIVSLAPRRQDRRKAIEDWFMVSDHSSPVIE